MQPDCYGTVVTEVQVTSDDMRYDVHGAPILPPVQHEAIICCGTPVSSLHVRQGRCTNSHKKDPSGIMKIKARLMSLKRQAKSKLARLDPVKMAYLRTSFIFGFSVLITWIPSSINRLYSLANDGKVSFHLSIASGCVLPLQGVWNALIYFTTGWTIVKEETATCIEGLKRRWARPTPGPSHQMATLSHAQVRRREFDDNRSWSI